MRWVQEKVSFDKKREKGRNATHPIVVLNLIPHAILHRPVPPRLESRSALSTKLALILIPILIAPLRTRRESLLLLKREVENRLRDGLEVVELVLRKAVPFEEEETLGFDAAEGESTSQRCWEVESASTVARSSRPVSEDSGGTQEGGRRKDAHASSS